MHTSAPHRRSWLITLCVLLSAAWLAPSASQSAPDAAPLPRARFHHIHINTVDPAASIRFYADRFKSAPAAFAGSPALKVENGWFLFNKVATPPPHESIAGFWHIGWGSPDMKGTYDRLVSLHTTFQTPLTNAGEFLQGKRGPLDFMYVEGVNGEVIELYTTDNIKFHHTHLLSANPQATSAWYLKYFGVPNTPERGGPTGIWVGDLNLITAGPDSKTAPDYVHGRRTFESSRGRALDHFAFGVDDLDQTLAQLQKDGVTVLQPPKTIMGGALTSAFVLAPDNVQLELVQERPRR